MNGERGSLANWFSPNWSAIVFYAISGLLLLIWPNQAMRIANYALAALLLIGGVISIISYIKSSASVGARGFRLSAGLVLLFFGIVILCNPDLLITVFPFLWGVALIIGGFGKTQMAFDMKRLDQKGWWWMLIGVSVSLILGVLAIWKPIAIATVVMQFIGISLIVEAIMDTVATIMIRNKLKDA